VTAIPSRISVAALPPIPPLLEPPNWARLPIDECGEPMVTLISGEARLITKSLYAALGIAGASEQITVRYGVRERLIRAAASLPDGIVLVVFDGFRPLMVQQHLYDFFGAEIARARPELSGEALRQAINEFVAVPNADPNCPPPHRTGGAVDVYLTDETTGEPLPMGTEPDSAEPESVTRWFEDHPQEPFTTNRRLLFHAMTSAGFTNYRGEWWHYDFGNQRWANCSGADSAMYGMAE
jgi:zinc D-Ala-D-Ala dipeptidase